MTQGIEWVDAFMAPTDGISFKGEGIDEDGGSITEKGWVTIAGHPVLIGTATNKHGKIQKHVVLSHDPKSGLSLVKEIGGDNQHLILDKKGKLRGWATDQAQGHMTIAEMTNGNAKPPRMKS